MQRLPIQSTALTGIGYDSATRRLEVEFNDGRVYEYFDVSEPVHAALIASPSKGRYFNGQIRGRFQYRERP